MSSATQFSWGAVFDKSLGYSEYLQTGNEVHQKNWNTVYERIQLTNEQTELLGKFRRQMYVLCMSGTWCGDCVEQCPILRRFEEACDVIELRFIDRDADEEVKQQLGLCGGARVPQVIFMNEDQQFIGHFGDRTLSKYRHMITELSGPACPSGLGPSNELLAATVQDWLNEFERLQWMLCMSPRLRERHGD